MSEDMGYECVTANGGETYKTPHLDRLASTGMRFEYCYSQPICTPSRVQLVTGKYNQRNYIRFGILDPEATTFAHLVKRPVTPPVLPAYGSSKMASRALIISALTSIAFGR